MGNTDFNNRKRLSICFSSCHDENLYLLFFLAFDNEIFGSFRPGEQKHGRAVAPRDQKVYACDQKVYVRDQKSLRAPDEESVNC